MIVLGLTEMNLSPKLLVPRLAAVPVQRDSGVCSHLDGSGFGGAHRLLHRLHQVLGVPDQHIGGLLVLVGALSSQHGGFHCREDLQLRTDGWNALANLQQCLLVINHEIVAGQVKTSSRTSLSKLELFKTARVRSWSNE